MRQDAHALYSCDEAITIEHLAIRLFTSKHIQFIPWQFEERGAAGKHEAKQ